MILKMAEHRIFLSPLFQHSALKSDYVFTNDLDMQLTRCTKSLRVRLLSFYSPTNLPPSYIYIEGMKRRSFGGLENEDFFPLPKSIGGKRHEDCHLYTGQISLHGISNWTVRMKARTNVTEFLQIAEDTVIELGISHVTENMNDPQYLSFNLPKSKFSLKLQSFQRIHPKARVGLVDVFIPRLANIYPPFNKIAFTSGKWVNNSNLVGGQEIVHHIPPDFYSENDIKELIAKILRTLGVEVKFEGTDVICSSGELGQKITLHKQLVDFLDVRGRTDGTNGDTSSFHLDGLSLGKTRELTSIPNPLFLECDLVEPTTVGLKSFQLLRLLFMDKSKKNSEGSVHIFENVQMIPMYPSEVYKITFKLVDFKGNSIYFANDNEHFSGTLLIKND